MNTVLRRLLFFASVFILIFLIASKTFDMYAITIVGVIYEILWLPVLLMIFAIPIAAVVWLIKEKFSFRSLNFYTLLLSVLNILLMILI